jgi:hypothetical protein
MLKKLAIGSVVAVLLSSGIFGIWRKRKTR